MNAFRYKSMWCIYITGKIIFQYWLKTVATNGHKLSIMTFAVHLKHLEFENSISTFNTAFLICRLGIATVFRESPKIQQLKWNV